MEQGSTSETLQASSSTSSSPSQSLEQVMKLLTGKTDSQRLAGLLLVTKFCDKNDQSTILDVYNALGSTFLHRLLLTGMGKGSGGGDASNREAYLRLSVTVLATFARLPQIAATKEMSSKIPLILEVMSGEYGPSLSEDCYEFLFLVSAAHEDGVVVTLYDSGGMNVLASQMTTLLDGSHVMELSMKLVQLILGKLPAEKVYVDHPSELSKMVAAIAKQFAVLHNALKFEALHLLSTILSSNYSGSLHVVLQSMMYDGWSTSIRAGIMDILQNRVAPAEKLQALVLAECVMSIVGEEWLIGPSTLHGANSFIPADRCILLVLESSRVEIAVILNELAYLKYEATKTSPNADTFLVKLRNLGVVFLLVERIIKLIAKFGDDEELNSTSIISESTFTKIIGGLNETIGLVLDYLQDAKDHGQGKGDDLLASVRIVASYLAEAPHACKEQVKELLGYMLSVEGEDESSPFYSISFLLPILCQITMKNDGCKIFASTGGFGAVVGCLISLISSSSSGKTDDGSTIFLACDTILNFLLKKEQLHLSVDISSYVKLLQALPSWTEGTLEPSVIMMASSMCSLILDSTSEEALLHHPDFNMDHLVALSQLMKKSLVTCGQDVMLDNGNSEADLHEIVSSGYSSWRDRFPLIKEVVER